MHNQRFKELLDTESPDSYGVSGQMKDRVPSRKGGHDWPIAGDIIESV
jgi:hypothetical protein